MEADTWNSVPNHSAEEKTTRNSFPWNKNKSKLSEFRSKAISDENILLAGEGFFFKTNVLNAISLRSKPRNLLFRKPRNASE
jgi:hypothetical protein